MKKFPLKKIPFKRKNMEETNITDSYPFLLKYLISLNLSDRYSVNKPQQSYRSCKVALINAHTSEG